MAKNTNPEIEIITQLAAVEAQIEALPGDNGKALIKLAEAQALLMDARVKRVKDGAS
ncbi:hypothetical protein KUW19_00670 [Ferrimonas balearica]|uniref:hypothetical protein n=1 Tax=Ferrimonas balearica TaxID=44012 RepID=UPI001C96E12E|nr:hypothetical protein [Ferrimonas balearica]MBY6104989.1 hypothetical protein [Ferrimonas balearica]